jgi:prepilin-type N-terminal cleavage/methylation domain-containing protein
MAKEGRGFSLLEVLISTAISLSAALIACRLAVGAQTHWRVAGARVDLQQRARAVADTLSRALLEAGAGPQAGPAYGPLSRYVPGVLPRRIGLRGAHAFDQFRRDVFTAIRVIADTTHATLSLPMPPGSTVMELAAVNGCAVPTCGFVEGSTVMLVDPDGSYDTFTVTDVAGASLTVRARGPGSGRTHRAGSPVLSIDSSSFFVDPTSSVLHRYDGDSSDVPAIDDVVAMDVRYYGGTQPPLWPRPPTGESNCLYDAAGAYQSALMPALTGVAGLIEMTAGMLSDGPWCGSGGTQFDADLLRLRRVRISVRLQASDPAVRGSDRQRFFNPGPATRETSMVPDVIVLIDTIPRNLGR